MARNPWTFFQSLHPLISPTNTCLRSQIEVAILGHRGVCTGSSGSLSTPKNYPRTSVLKSGVFTSQQNLSSVPWFSCRPDAQLRVPPPPTSVLHHPHLLQCFSQGGSQEATKFKWLIRGLNVLLFPETFVSKMDQSLNPRKKTEIAGRGFLGRKSLHDFL